MNVKLMFAAVAGAMAQDHVGPQELITSLCDVANNIADSLGNVVFATCTVNDATRIEAEARAEELAVQFRTYCANFKAIGYSDAELFAALSVEAAVYALPKQTGDALDTKADETQQEHKDGEYLPKDGEQV